MKKAEMNREWKQEEREQGVRILIETCEELGEDKQKIIFRIQSKYPISREDAEMYVKILGSIISQPIP